MLIHRRTPDPSADLMPQCGAWSGPEDHRVRCPLPATEITTYMDPDEAPTMILSCRAHAQDLRQRCWDEGIEMKVFSISTPCRI